MKNIKTLLMVLVLILAIGALAALCIVNFLLPQMNVEYPVAHQRFMDKEKFTLTAANTMTVEAESGSNTVEYTAQITKNGDEYHVSESDGSTTTDYYFSEGTVYVNGASGKFRWQDDEEGFLAMFCYAPPLNVGIVGEGRQDEGESVYFLSVDGAEHVDTLLALNPQFAEIDPTGVTFNSFDYTARVKGEDMTGYIYDYSFDSYEEEVGDTSVRNTLTVTVDKKAGKVELPGDTDSYEESKKDLADVGLSEEVFNEQMLYVIFESLYDPDGTESENFDAYYEQFEEQYGEEFMKKIVDIAALINSKLAAEYAG